MTHGALRVSAIALGAAAFVSLSPLSAASAATSTSPETVQHPAHTYAHHYTHHGYPHAHYVWRNGRRYVWNGHSYVYSYGYNPGAAAAAGVIGGHRRCGRRLSVWVRYPMATVTARLRLGRLLRAVLRRLRLRIWPGFLRPWLLWPSLRLRPRLPGPFRRRKLRPHGRVWRRRLRRTWAALAEATSAASAAAIWAALAAARTFANLRLATTTSGGSSGRPVFAEPLAKASRIRRYPSPYAATE